MLPVHAHDPAWAAVATLRAIVLGQRPLQGVVTGAPVPETLHRLYLPVLAGRYRHQALENIPVYYDIKLH
jgi:hypothetical protein